MPRTLRPSFRHERLVLNFHGIGEVPPHVVVEERPYWTTQQDFHVLLDAVKHLSPTSGVPIEITFDDGNVSDLTQATPALTDRGLRATFFVCAGRMGHPGYLNPGQIRELRDAGMAVGCHGWGHVDWRRADDATLDQELRVARERISEVLGHTITEAAVPFGSYDRRVVRAVRESGFRTLYTSDRGRAGSGWIVPRETWMSEWSPRHLRGLVHGRHTAREGASSVVRLAKRLR